MIGITTLARRVFVACLAIGLFAAVSAPAAAAQEPTSVRQFFDDTELADVNAAAAYLGVDLQTFAQSSVEVHFFLLSIGGKFGANECSLGLNATIERHSGTTQTWLGYPGDLASKFVAIANHYCLDDVQTQRFNLTLLTFLAASNASQAGLSLPAAGLPDHVARTNGFDVEPAEGWTAYFDAELADLAALPMAELGECGEATATDLLDDLVTLLYDTWSHPDATRQGVGDHISNLYGHVDLRNAALCAGDTEAALTHTGAAHYLAMAANVHHLHGVEWTVGTGPLHSHEIRRAGRDGLTVWDVIVSLVEDLLDHGEVGLHAGSCWSVDTSYYNETAQELIGWQASIATYVAETAVSDLDAAGLQRSADLLGSVGSMLTTIHNTRCRPPMDDAAAFDLVEPYTNLLFELIVLMNVGHST